MWFGWGVSAGGGAGQSAGSVALASREQAGEELERAISGFLDYIAVVEGVAVATQRQALNALIFAFRACLGMEPGLLPEYRGRRVAGAAGGAVERGDGAVPGLRGAEGQHLGEAAVRGWAALVRSVEAAGEGSGLRPWLRDGARREGRQGSPDDFAGGLGQAFEGAFKTGADLV